VPRRLNWEIPREIQKRERERIALCTLNVVATFGVDVWMEDNAFVKGFVGGWIEFIVWILLDGLEPFVDEVK